MPGDRVPDSLSRDPGGAAPARAWPPPSALLPHAGRMAWLDRVTHHDGEGTACEAIVRADSPLADARASLEQSAALIALQERVKGVFDPEGIMNPGKIFPAAARRFHGAC